MVIVENFKNVVIGDCELQSYVTNPVDFKFFYNYLYI